MATGSPDRSASGGKHAEENEKEEDEDEEKEKEEEDEEEEVYMREEKSSPASRFAASH